jgi:hypothetical protein
MKKVESCWVGNVSYVHGPPYRVGTLVAPKSGLNYLGLIIQEIDGQLVLIVWNVK